MKPSGIGGQAVIEGVMMKNQDVYAVAVRKPDKTIEIKNEKYTSFQKTHPFFGIPIIRGVVSFIESMVIGMKTLTYSSSFYEEEEQTKPNKMEEKMGAVFKDKAENVVMGFTVLCSILLAVGIFMILPFWAAEFFKKIVHNTTVLAIIEGVIRITIFIAYVVGISFMEDIKRVFMYHGAEHKTINCVENGLPLTIKNVKKQSRYHKRCGTSFMFIVMFISILFFILIKFDNVWIRMGCRILLIPVVAGISYEFIRFAGRSESKIMNILSRPGMWMQSLTTKEPDDSMIEVAIASVEAVFDWKKYQEEEKEIEKEMKKIKKDLAATAEVVNRHVKEDLSKNKSEEKKEIKNNKSEVKAAKKAENSRTVTAARHAREKELADQKAHSDGINILDDEEDDEILRALDKFFVYNNEKKES